MQIEFWGIFFRVKMQIEFWGTFFRVKMQIEFWGTFFRVKEMRNLCGRECSSCVMFVKKRL